MEVHTNKSRIDAVIEGKDCVFIAEFKMGTAREAMEQIHRNRYYEAYAGESRTVYLVAVGFSETERNITDFEIREYGQ